MRIAGLILVVSAALMQSPSGPRSTSGAPAGASGPDAAVEMVNGAPNPVLRFPVAHQHFSSMCFGYLYFSRDAIWYEVEAPGKNLDHSFRERRGDLEHARQWVPSKIAMPVVELKFRDATYRFFHLSRATMEAHSETFGWDQVLPYEDLWRAATMFDEAVRIAGTVSPQATLMPTASDSKSLAVPSAIGLLADSPIALTCASPGTCTAAVLLRLEGSVPAGSLTVMLMSGENLWTGTASLPQASPAVVNVVVKGPAHCPLDPNGRVLVYAGTHADQPLGTTAVTIAGSCR